MQFRDYEVLSELGRGGMGRVFEVRHRPTGARRALKVIVGRADPEAVERLRREGEALARVGGDGVVPVHEAGVERGQPFIVCGLMSGSLRKRLLEAGRLEWREAARIVATVARALARCHAAGLVHRDVKPDNVLFDEEGRPRLADFGCVRDLGEATLTATGQAPGTLAYMAPEQLDGQRATAAADVYALGVVLHELVSGAQPFASASSPFRHLEQKLEAARPRVEAPLNDLLDRALAPDPARRPSAAELADLLDAVASGPARARRGPRVAALAALALGAVGLAIALRPRPASVPVAPPPPPVLPPAAPQPPAARRWTIEEVLAAWKEHPEDTARIASDALAENAGLSAELRAHAENWIRPSAPTTPESATVAVRALAVLATAGGPLDRAVADVTKILERLSKSRDVPHERVVPDELVRACAELGVHAKRLEHPELGRRIANLAEHRYVMGVDRTKRDLVQAMAAAAARISPYSPKAHYVLGRFLLLRSLREGRPELRQEARAEMERVVLEPGAGFSVNDVASACIVLARIEELDGRWGDAMRALVLQGKRSGDGTPQVNAAIDGTADAWRLRTRVLLRMGDRENALNTARTGQAHEAAAAIERGDPIEAIEPLLQGSF